MPSKTVKQLLGEADVKRPSDIKNIVAPTTGQEGRIKWKVHRVLGVAPVDVDEGLYEQWLEDLALSNVDSPYATNEVPISELSQLNIEGPREMNEFIEQAKVLARRLHADVVAFTTVEGVQ